MSQISQIDMISSQRESTLAGHLAVLVAYSRAEKSHRVRDEALARAIARLAVQLRASRPLEREASPEEKEGAVVEAEETPYEDVVARIRDAVSRVVPVGARVAIVSRGDGDLLRIPGRNGRHFPSTRDGRYAGFYPADGNTALAQLKEAIQSGVAYLAIPETGRWWLNFYAEFGAFLRTDCRTLVDDPGLGAVFDLVSSAQESN